MTETASKAKKQQATSEEDWRELMLFSFGWLSGALDQLAQESVRYRALRHLSCIFLARLMKGLERGQITLDLTTQRVLKEAKVTWPEADPNKSDIDSTLIAGLILSRDPQRGMKPR